MASPRTWNKTVSATDTASSHVVGATATPFGPSTIYVYNSSSTDECYITITMTGANTTATTATSTSDGVSWRVPAGKEVAFNFDSQNSANTYTVSVVMASGKTATVYLNAIQAF